MTTSVPTVERQAQTPPPLSPTRSFADHVLAVARDRMDRAGMTQYRLIKVTGIPQHRVYRWFSHARPMRLDELFLVALALDVDPAELVAEAKRRYDQAGR